MKKLMIGLMVIVVNGSIALAQTTNFIEAFNAIWNTHDASNILAFVEQNVATNKSPETLFARGIVAFTLQLWPQGASDCWEEAIQMIVPDNAHFASWQTNAISKVQEFRDVFKGEEGNAPSWDANMHKIVFARCGDEAPLLDDLKTMIDPGWMERQDAVSKSDDQAFLAEVAKNDSHEEVRMAAVEKLKDQKLLTEIAESNEIASVRRVAVGRLTDQALLVKFAKNEKDGYVRQAAVGQLEDQTLLAEIAQNDSDEQVRIVALRKLNDKKLLAEIIESGETRGVWNVATARLSLIRRIEVGKLEDQALLATIANNDEDYPIRVVAIEKLNDQVTLQAIADNDKNGYVRSAARNRLQALQKDGYFEEEPL